MHKLTKGLKKKKKGKKSKRSEEDLFKPEELEAYRKQHQTDDLEKTKEKDNDEWKKFTAGIDSVLKRTQDDLNRIKSTSFFQPIQTTTVPDKEVQEPTPQILKPAEEETVTKDVGIVGVSESEGDEDEEDIFDTSYIDAIAVGEVKLAYIPDSPADRQNDNDPFDTSIAERAILGPAAEKKGRKLVPIGAAVEVLTGKVQAPTCVPVKKTTRRAVLPQQNLTSEDIDASVNGRIHQSKKEYAPTLLDTDDTPREISTTLIDLSKNLLPIVKKEPKQDISSTNGGDINKSININEATIDSNTNKDVNENQCLSTITPELSNGTTFTQHWNAFVNNSLHKASDGVGEDFVESDPFDTSFAENSFPSQTEIRLIEKEILNSEERNQGNIKGSDTSQIALNCKGKLDKNDRKLCDPSDTCLVNKNIVPSKIGLKCIEQALHEVKNTIQNKDKDPEEEVKGKCSPTSNKNHFKSVEFVLPISNDYLTNNGKEGNRCEKPLTPYYINKECILEDSENKYKEVSDPFDTSFVNNVTKSKTPEYINFKETTIKQSTNISNVEDSKFLKNDFSERLDLLVSDQQLSSKTLNPTIESAASDFNTYCDPFDSTITNNLIFEDSELNLSEKKLHNTEGTFSSKPNTSKSVETSPGRNRNVHIQQPADLLEQIVELTATVPLIPVQSKEINEKGISEDPFDTSIADNIDLRKN